VGPRNVLLLTAEDGLADTILPRLLAAGANPRYVCALGDVKEPERDEKGKVIAGQFRARPLTLPTDIGYLQAYIARYDAALVIIDPLMAFLSGDVNSWRDQDMRSALRPLSEMAARTDCAILILRHLSKAQGQSALYRGGGSIGIIGAARSGLLVTRHPDDPERRLLCSTKSNLDPKRQRRWRFGSRRGWSVAGGR
jgi:hypothetical protein